MGAKGNSGWFSRNIRIVPVWFLLVCRLLFRILGPVDWTWTGCCITFNMLDPCRPSVVEGNKKGNSGGENEGVDTH